MAYRGSKLPKRISLLGLLSLGIALAALLVALGLPRWEMWDYFRAKEPMDKLVVISARLRNDAQGTYTSEIRNEISRRGWRYRSIDRVFPRNRIVASSAQNSPSEILRAQRILDIHGGDVFIYGEVGLRDIVRVGLYIQSTQDQCCRSVELDLASEEWRDVLMEEIESLAYSAATTPLVDGPPASTGIPVEDLLGFTGKKLRELSLLSTDSELRSLSTDAAEYATTVQAKMEQDAQTLRELRLRLEQQGATSNHQESNAEGVARELRIADLYMYEGLIDDNPQIVEQGLRVALALPADTLGIEMERLDIAVQPAARADDTAIGLMTSLILACGDHAMMERMMDLVIERGTCRIAGSDSDCSAETLQTLLGLHVHVVLEEIGELEQGIGLLAPLVDAGHSDWWDPLNQSMRLGQRELQEGSSERIGNSSRTYCPSLAEWMSRKGWSEVVVGGEEQQRD